MPEEVRCGVLSGRLAGEAAPTVEDAGTWMNSWRSFVYPLRLRLMKASRVETGLDGSASSGNSSDSGVVNVGFCVLMRPTHPVASAPATASSGPDSLLAAQSEIA